MEFAFILALLAGLIYFLICFVVSDNELQDAKAKLKSKEEEEQKQLKESLEQADIYIQDLEDEKEELASGYSLMATTIEALQSEIEDIHKWIDGTDAHMEKHCEQINSILDVLQKPLAAQIVRVQQPTNDYTGPDEDTDEDPYPEPPAVLPDWAEVAINTIEGLDEL